MKAARTVMACLLLVAIPIAGPAGMNVLGMGWVRATAAFVGVGAAIVLLIPSWRHDPWWRNDDDEHVPWTIADLEWASPPCADYSVAMDPDEAMDALCDACGFGSYDEYLRYHQPRQMIEDGDDE